MQLIRSKESSQGEAEVLVLVGHAGVCWPGQEVWASVRKGTYRHSKIERAKRSSTRAPCLTPTTRHTHTRVMPIVPYRSPVQDFLNFYEQYSYSNPNYDLNQTDHHPWSHHAVGGIGPLTALTIHSPAFPQNQQLYLPTPNRPFYLPPSQKPSPPAAPESSTSAGNSVAHPVGGGATGGWRSGNGGLGEWFIPEPEEGTRSRRSSCASTMNSEAERGPDEPEEIGEVVASAKNSGGLRAVQKKCVAPFVAKV